MATVADLQYAAIFGSGDASDWIDWEVTLSEEAEEAYLEATTLRLPFENYPVLDDVLSAAYAEIEESEIENFVDCDDEYVLECTGRYEVDPDEINDLVAERDEHTLEFFGITEMSDEELDEWDAYDVDLPFVCDFVEGFEAESPFDAGWTLRVNFSNHPEEEDLDEDEAVKTLTELLKKADGDYSVLDDYVERCDNLFTGSSLQLLACSVARELNLQDYADTHTTEVK